MFTFIIITLGILLAIEVISYAYDNYNSRNKD